MAEAGRRKKALLAEFYKQGQAVGATKDVDTSNIDGPHFDAEQYCNNLLNTESLAALQKRDATLDHEISSFDSEMKTLVYDNYSKFISATDVIKKVKNNVENRQEEMKTLEKCMTLLTDRTEKIDRELNPKRDAMQQLGAVHKLLHKLQFLVELPQRLQQCIQLKSYWSGVKYFENALPVLQKYRSLPAFRTIEESCQKLIEVMRKDLVVCLETSNDTTTTANEVREAAQLLLAMGSDRALIARQFVAWHDAATTRMLAPLETPPVQHKQLPQVSARLLPHLVDMHEAYVDTFVKQQPAAGTVGSGVFAGKSAATASSSASGSTVAAPPATAEWALSWCRAVLTRFLTAARTSLLVGRDVTNTLAQLKPVQSDLVRAHAQLPAMGFAQNALDLVNQVVNELAAHVFDAASARAVRLVQGDDEPTSVPPTPLADVALRETGATPITSAQAAALAPTGASASELAFTVRARGNAIGDAVARLIEQAVASLRPLFDTAAAASARKQTSLLGTKVQVKFQQVLLALSIALADYADSPSHAGALLPRTGAALPRALDARHTLFLVHTTRFLQLKALSRCHDALRRLLGDAAGGADGVSVVNIVDVQTRLAAVAESLLHRYVALVAQGVTGALLQHPLEYYGDDVLKQMEACRIDVVACGFAASTAATTTSAQSAAPRDNRLFDRRVDAFAKPQFANSSILACVLMRSSKSIIELVRASTLTKAQVSGLVTDVQRLEQQLSPLLANDLPKAKLALQDVIGAVNARAIE